MTRRLQAAAAVALLLGSLPALDALAATSGFGRPAASSPAASSPARSAPSAPSAPAPAPSRPSSTTGFTRPAPSAAAPAARPTGALDTAVSGGVSRDAYDAYKARQAPPAPANADAAPAQPGFMPNGSRPAAPPVYAPPVYAQPVPAPGYQPSYGYRDNSGDFTNGVLVGSLIGQLGQRHDDGRYTNYEVQRQLQDIADHTSDPALRQRIDDRLHPAVANPVDASRAGGGGHAVLWTLIAVLVLGGVAAWFLYGRKLMAARAPVAATRATASAAPTRKAPDVPDMEFRPGGYVNVAETPLILAQAGGSDLPDSVAGRHAVASVGSFVQRGVEVRRAYYDGGKAFVERATSNDNGAPQVRVYHLADEQVPDADEWAFFLGGRNAAGEVQEAYIGMASVTLPPTNHDWFRTWGAGDAAVAPQQVVERVEGEAAGRREHSVMQYHREIGVGTDGKPAFEYAYLERVDDGKVAAVRTWVGIDVTPASVQAA